MVVIPQEGDKETDEDVVFRLQPPMVRVLCGGCEGEASGVTSLCCALCGEEVGERSWSLFVWCLLNSLWIQDSGGLGSIHGAYITLVHQLTGNLTFDKVGPFGCFCIV